MAADVRQGHFHRRIAEKFGGVDMSVVCALEATRVDCRITPKCLPDPLEADSHAIERCHREARAWICKEAHR